MIHIRLPPKERRPATPMTGRHSSKDPERHEDARDGKCGVSGSEDFEIMERGETLRAPKFLNKLFYKR